VEGTRIGRVAERIAYARAHPDVSKADETTSDGVAQAAREVHQLRKIVDELSRAPEVSGWLTVATRLVKGAELPEDDGARSDGRNIQFELLVAALARVAGYFVRCEEPDVIVGHPANPAFGLAVKRASSAANFEKLVKRGEVQILRSGFSGAVVIDVTRLIVADLQGVVVADTPLAAKERLAFTLGRFQRSHDELLRRIQSKGLLGVAFYAQVLFAIEGGLCTMEHWNLHTSTTKAKGRRLFSAFTKAVAAATEKWYDGR
jgi:hypothetical protein